MAEEVTTPEKEVTTPTKEGTNKYEWTPSEKDNLAGVESVEIDDQKTFNTEQDKSKAGSEDDFREDYMMKRLMSPNTDTETLMEIYGVNGFTDFKTREDYWADKAVQKSFVDAYGLDGKLRFDERYSAYKREFSEFQLGNFQKSSTAFELQRDTFAQLRSGVSVRYNNMEGSVRTGFGWGEATRDPREAFNSVRTSYIDENGDRKFKYETLTPDYLKFLELDDSFGGLAYGDAMMNLDPKAEVSGVYFDTIHDGKVYNDYTKDFVDVRNDQVVSRWDIDTGSILDGMFKSNGIEANGVLDYAKTVVKSPINMWHNIQDTAFQLLRALTAGGVGMVNSLIRDDFNLDQLEMYKDLTNAGIRAKSGVTSMSREALTDGFFGSPEAFLSTIMDVTLQVGLARGLSFVGGKIGTGVGSLIGGGLKGQALAKLEADFSKKLVYGTLTAMAAKDSYNEALENGFTTTEASIITGATVYALNQAMKYSSYILGDYEPKVIRANVKKVVQKEQKTIIEKAFGNYTKTIKDVTKQGNEKSKFAISHLTKKIKESFDKVFTQLPPHAFLYEARQEALEEMTEELYQDGVKHAASAYGVLMKDAKEVGKGRYQTIFDEGYFKDAVERYATSGIAGGIGGAVGMVGSHRVNLNAVTSASSIVDIIVAGKTTELVQVLQEMAAKGELGPVNLSTKYDIDEGIFEPILKGSQAESLGEMTYKLYLHDINVIQGLMKKGHFSSATQAMQEMDGHRESVNNTAMRKDFVDLMGEIVDFHAKTGISTDIYTGMEKMSERQLEVAIPKEAQGIAAKLAEKRKQVESLEASIKKASVKDVSGADEEKGKITEVKAKTKRKSELNPNRIEEQEAKLATLKTALERAESGVSEKDLIRMFNNYRKIRAIGNGSAAELYMMQNELYDHNIFGDETKRDPEFKSLGAQPFTDKMLHMRYAASNAKEMHLLKFKKAKDVTESIKDIKDLSGNNTDKIRAILTESSGSVTKEAYEYIQKLFDAKELSPIADKFKTSGKGSLVTNADGDFDHKKAINLLKLLASHNPSSAITEENTGPLSGTLSEELERVIDKVKDYFDNLSNNIENQQLPNLQTEEDIEALDLASMHSIYIDYADLGPAPVLSTIRNSKDPALVALRKTIPAEVFNAQDIAALATKALNSTDGYYKPEKFQKYDVSLLLNVEKNGSITDESILANGMSIINNLLENQLSGKIGKSEPARHSLKELKKQIKIKEAFAHRVMGFAQQGLKDGEIEFFSTFRKNVIDIIDNEYLFDEISDTDVERHLYKDYSAASDFFVDFVYDPIREANMRKKGVDRYTRKDKEAAAKRDRALTLLLPQVKEITDVEFPINTKNAYVIDKDRLHMALDAEMIARGNPDGILMFKAAMDTFFKNPKASIIAPVSVLMQATGEEPIGLALNGVTQLLAFEWLLDKADGILAEVNSEDSHVRYTQDKDAEVIKTKDVFAKFLAEPEFESLNKAIEYDVINNKPQFQVYLTSSTDKDVPVIADIAAWNRYVEHMIFRAFNDTDDSLGLDTTKLMEMRDALIEYVLDLSYRSGTYSSESAFRQNLLVGALTTDFTSFYKKFKQAIIDGEKDGEKEQIVISAQETAAKYAVAAATSPTFLSTFLEVLPETGNNKFKALYLGGAAGTGKTTALIKLGMSIASEIISEPSVYYENAVAGTQTEVLGAAMNIEQLITLDKSLEGFNGGDPSLVYDELFDLVQSAVTTDATSPEKTSEALTKLAKKGVIIIDEITGVVIDEIDPNTKERAVYLKDEKTLHEFLQNLEKYNSMHRKGMQKLVTLVAGDTEQSSKAVVDENKNILSNIHIKQPLQLRTPQTPRLKFSFRGKNRHLRDGLSAIKNIKPAHNFSLAKKPIALTEETKYSIQDGVFYGVNLVQGSSEPGLSAEFVTMLTDKEFLESIKQRLENEPDFTMIIAPESMGAFTNKSFPPPAGTVGIKDLIEQYGEKIIVGDARMLEIQADKVRGSQANYVIAELGDIEGVSETNYVHPNVGKEMVSILNTLASRAIDYAIVINKANSLSIDTPSIISTGGLIGIPSAAIDLKGVQAYRAYLLGLLEDIESSAPSDTKDDDAGGGGFGTTPFGKKYFGKQEEALFKDKDSPLEITAFKAMLESQFEDSPLRESMHNTLTALSEALNGNEDSKIYLEAATSAIKKIVGDDLATYFGRFHTLITNVIETRDDEGDIGEYAATFTGYIDTLLAAIATAPMNIEYSETLVLTEEDEEITVKEYLEEVEEYSFGLTEGDLIEIYELGKIPVSQLDDQDRATLTPVDDLISSAFIGDQKIVGSPFAERLRNDVFFILNKKGAEFLRERNEADNAEEDLPSDNGVIEVIRIALEVALFQGDVRQKARLYYSYRNTLNKIEAAVEEEEAGTDSDPNLGISTASVEAHKKDLYAQFSNLSVLKMLRSAYKTELEKDREDPTSQALLDDIASFVGTNIIDNLYEKDGFQALENAIVAQYAKETDPTLLEQAHMAINSYFKFGRYKDFVVDDDTVEPTIGEEDNYISEARLLKYKKDQSRSPVVFVHTEIEDKSKIFELFKEQDYRHVPDRRFLLDILTENKGPIKDVKLVVAATTTGYKYEGYIAVTIVDPTNVKGETTYIVAKGETSYTRGSGNTVASVVDKKGKDFVISDVSGKLMNMTLENVEGVVDRVMVLNKKGNPKSSHYAMSLNKSFIKELSLGLGLTDTAGTGQGMTVAELEAKGVRISNNGYIYSTKESDKAAQTVSGHPMVVWSWDTRTNLDNVANITAIKTAFSAKTNSPGGINIVRDNSSEVLKAKMGVAKLSFIPDIAEIHRINVLRKAAGKKELKFGVFPTNFSKVVHWAALNQAKKALKESVNESDKAKYGAVVDKLQKASDDMMDGYRKKYVHTPAKYAKLEQNIKELRDFIASDVQIGATLLRLGRQIVEVMSGENNDPNTAKLFLPVTSKKDNITRYALDINTFISHIIAGKEVNKAAEFTELLKKSGIPLYPNRDESKEKDSSVVMELDKDVIKDFATVLVTDFTSIQEPSIQLTAEGAAILIAQTDKVADTYRRKDIPPRRGSVNISPLTAGEIEDHVFNTSSAAAWADYAGVGLDAVVAETAIITKMLKNRELTETQGEVLGQREILGAREKIMLQYIKNRRLYEADSEGSRIDLSDAKEILRGRLGENHRALRVPVLKFMKAVAEKPATENEIIKFVSTLNAGQKDANTITHLLRGMCGLRG